MNIIKRIIKKTFLYHVLANVYDYSNEKVRMIKFLLNLIFKRFNTDIVFFFTSFGTGGAEWIHLQIAQLVSQRKPIIFFTSVSLDNKYKSEFDKAAICFCLAPLIWKNKLFKKLTFKIIATKLNFKKKSFTFGSDSSYYYELIPYFNKNVICYDLFHTLVHDYENGPESWSKNVVDRIDKRITYNIKTLNDLEAFYIKNNISEANIKKHILIYNKFYGPETYEAKNYSDVLNFLFVGRSDVVKRIHLIGRIAKKIKENSKYSARCCFYLIGPDIDKLVTEDCIEYCNFVGHIKDTVSINSWYKKAHFLIMTSSREGMPVSIMEAMSNGVIPICTDVGGINELVIDHQTGFLINSYPDENLIVEKATELICDIINQNELLSGISENVYNYLKDKFGVDQFNKSYLELFEK